MAGTDWCKSCGSFGGEVCGSVCHPASGTEHSLGPLETFGGSESVTGKQQHVFNHSGN